MGWDGVGTLALATYISALWSVLVAAEVNVDSQIERIFSVFNDGRKEQVMPLLPFEHIMDPIVFPGITTTCDEGKVFAPLMYSLKKFDWSVMFWNGARDIKCCLMAVLTIQVGIQVVSGGVVNVDALIPDIILELRAISAQMPDGALPLNPIRANWSNSVLPFKFDFECIEGYGRAPDVSRRMGNTLDIVSQNQTILHMKLRCGEAQFFYPNCIIDSNTRMFTAVEMQLEGVLQNSDFDIAVILNHYPTCNATLGDVSLVEMSNMSFKFLESKLPKVLSDLISNFLAKYNKKLLDDCVVRAVEESISQLTQKIDLCEIFHPNLRLNDEL